MANEVTVELRSELSEVEKAVSSIVIDSQEGYETAAELARKIKKTEAKVKDYWEPMRISTKQAYDDVLDHKKEMMSPLEKAEKVLKGKMSDYLSAVEAERKRKEEELRKLAEAEMMKKLAEAEDAEKNGDGLGAEFAMAEAEMYDAASQTMTVAKQNVKADGVSYAKSWEIVSIDPNKVPTFVNGVEIRPVDEGAVKRLIKACGGNIKIDGVVFKETYVMGVRK